MTTHSVTGFAYEGRKLALEDRLNVEAVVEAEREDRSSSPGVILYHRLQEVGRSNTYPGVDLLKLG